MNLMDEHVEDYRFGQALDNALRQDGMKRVIAGWRPEPKREMPKKCGRCYGRGIVREPHPRFAGCGVTGICPECDGLGSVMVAC